MAEGLRRDTAANVVILRGDKMMTREAFFQESAAALQFPMYFGDNWDAWIDCMREIPERWNQAEENWIVFLNASELLIRESRHQHIAVESLGLIAGEFEALAHDSATVRILLQGAEAQLSEIGYAITACSSSDISP